MYNTNHRDITWRDYAKTHEWKVDRFVARARYFQLIPTILDTKGLVCEHCEFSVVEGPHFIIDKPFAIQKIKIYRYRTPTVKYFPSNTVYLRFCLVGNCGCISISAATLRWYLKSSFTIATRQKPTLRAVEQESGMVRMDMKWHGWRLDFCVLSGNLTVCYWKWHF